MTDVQPRSWYNLPGHLYDMATCPRGRGQLLLYLSFIPLFFAIGGFRDHGFWMEQEVIEREREKVTPIDQRMGWDEMLAKSESPRIAAQMPAFAITDTDGNRLSGAGKNAELWKFAKLANGGKHIPTWRQESGDCVSMGWSNAIAYLQAYRICNPKVSPDNRDERNEVLKIPFPPYMYGVSRVLVGKRQLGRGAGSVGAWAAQGSIAYGVLPIDQAESLGFKYSGKLADQWGWNGPPESTLKFSKDFRIRTIAPVRSWEDARDALAHGFTVTVASNVGFEGGSYEKDGKRWLRPRGNWGHQMCFIGMEDRPGLQKGCYDINSWGENAHEKPLNDEPPGGFWVDWQTVQRMVSQGDSWAYSDFDGFTAERTAEWDAFSVDAIQVAESTDVPDVVAALDAVDNPTPEPEPILKEVRKSWSLPVSSGLAVLFAAMVVGGVYLKHSSRSQCA